MSPAQVRPGSRAFSRTCSSGPAISTPLIGSGIALGLAKRLPPNRTRSKEKQPVTETNEWSTAPKDGSEINIQFPDGTKARARWNAENGGEWQAQRATVNGREWPAQRATVN